MRKLAFLSAIAVVSLASPSLAQDPRTAGETSQANDGTPNDASGDAKMICKKQEVTGSLARSRKVCRTKAEWNRISQDMQSQMRDYVDHGRGGTNGD